MEAANKGPREGPINLQALNDASPSQKYGEEHGLKRPPAGVEVW